jgi:hypothetical protein
MSKVKQPSDFDAFTWFSLENSKGENLIEVRVPNPLDAIDTKTRLNRLMGDSDKNNCANGCDPAFRKLRLEQLKEMYSPENIENEISPWDGKTREEHVKDLEALAEQYDSIEIGD